MDVSNDIPSYNFPPPQDTAYSSIDVNATDAVFAEETQPVIKINSGNIYDDPEYQRHVTRLTNTMLKPFIVSNGERINLNYVCIVQAPQLPQTEDLFVKQHLINAYLQRVLGLNTTLFQLLQTTPGISAPLYKAYVLILIKSLPNVDKRFLHKIDEAMYSFYISWADQIPALIEIVLNTNGQDVMKEMMTVVNQSVYRLLYLILRANNIEGIENVQQFYALPFDQLSDAIFPDDEARNTTNNHQRVITNKFIDKFNEAVFNKVFKRYYLLSNPTADISIPYIPKININTLNTEITRLFRLQRVPTDLFDNPGYSTQPTNKVYLDSINDSYA